MAYLVYVFKILYYFVFAFIMFALGKNAVQQRPFVLRVGNIHLGSRQGENTKRKILIRDILFLCILIGFYGVICGRVPYSSDRGNYALRFADDGYLRYVKSGSLGLYWIEVILHLFTHDPRWLFFTIPFLSLLVTLIAYNSFPDIAPEALLFMGLSAYCIESFYLYKQAPAMAIAALSLALFLKNKKIGSLFLLIVATAFHEAAWILFPIFVAMIGFKSKFIRVLSYIFLFVSLFFFPQISRLVVSIVNLIPGMDMQISNYIDETGAIQQSLNYLTALKGMPYYFISIIAIIKRPVLKNRITDYDRYLFLSCFVSITILLSTFMYWMFRFGAFCYFPVFVFASLIYRETDDPREKLWFKYCLCLLLAFFTLRSLYQHYFMYGGF